MVQMHRHKMTISHPIDTCLFFVSVFKKVATCMDDEDEVLLIYPFTKNVREMDSACLSLTELGDETCHDGGLVSLCHGNADESVVACACACRTTTAEDEVIFRDLLRITVKDYRLLQPDQYWNDILIDFWMRWISRSEKVNTTVFFFTAQFYTELAARSPEAMTKWLKRKGINLFEKKLLFIPIHAELHWTLAVIVNPGHILSMVAKKESGRDRRTSATTTTPFPCILFFDSLKNASRGTEHDAKTVAKNIRNLLNYEWSRLGKAAELKCIDPFNERSMMIVTPKGKW
jgi:Ulp1 protease family, C-terminal catalytic domain